MIMVLFKQKHYLLHLLWSTTFQLFVLIMLDRCSGKCFRTTRPQEGLAVHVRKPQKWKKTEENAIISTLKKVPFSITTDGSNKGDFKLYLLVVTFHSEETQKIESSLLFNLSIRR
ncbi:hypothetical protein AVEN_218435-1 [Araneus ventricosus]|uniref:Uncharacterized protein n=1 Tax=Araneus ventricosus TaxID=182803 RepID=A0A4Y2QXN0_ARAVE|nr:hypothetical protein AVEN_218435-1 [Araneus ventricosus]